MAADPIWLEKLKRLFSQSRITQERPNFTGTPGYNTNILNPNTGKSSWKELWKDNVRLGDIGGGFKSLPDLSAEGKVLAKGSLVDPHLAAAAGGPGWGSGMAPSTMTKVGKKGPTAEERAEAWKQAMADAPGMLKPDLLPGASVGRTSKIETAPYRTGGYDLASNRPIADTEKVRKRLYGIMGFA